MTILTPEETAAEEIRAPPSSFCLLWSQTKTVKKNPRRLTLLTTRIGFPPVFTPFIAASLGIANSWALRFPSAACLRHLFLPQASVLSCFFFFFPAKEQEYVLYSPGTMDSRKSQLSEILLCAMG